MKDVLAFVIGVPLAAELLGACFSVFDCWRQPDARAAAVERLARPMLLWGALWWMVGADAGVPLWSALVLVGLWQAASFYIVRMLSHWSGYQTPAIDTDTNDGATPKEKKNPGDNGDWGGERESPGR